LGLATGFFWIITFIFPTRSSLKSPPVAIYPFKSLAFKTWTICGEEESPPNLVSGNDVIVCTRAGAGRKLVFLRFVDCVGNGDFNACSRFDSAPPLMSPNVEFSLVIFAPGGPSDIVIIGDVGVLDQGRFNKFALALAGDKTAVESEEGGLVTMWTGGGELCAANWLAMIGDDRADSLSVNGRDDTVGIRAGAGR
jgi:hypothetical protein